MSFQTVGSNIFQKCYSYRDVPPKMVVCNRCGSNKFYVGHGDYLTVVSCTNCKREMQVHDG